MEALYASASIGLGLIGFAAGRIVAFNKIADLTGQLSSANHRIKALEFASEARKARASFRNSRPFQRRAEIETARALGMKEYENG